MLPVSSLIDAIRHHRILKKSTVSKACTFLSGNKESSRLIGESYQPQFAAQRGPLPDDLRLLFVDMKLISRVVKPGRGGSVRSCTSLVPQTAGRE